MQFRSTRGEENISLDAALAKGIADDGGLFVPNELVRYAADDFREASSIQDVARVVLQPYFATSRLAPDLDEIIAETFSFAIPVRRFTGDDEYAALLELFHGPTAAFKDVGAGFLAACLSRLEGDDANPLTVLVATSGDTGGAVAAAFNERPGMRVAVLYPDGRVSKRQEQQLTCWGDNVLSLAVQGSFDDCQALVKSAMADSALASEHRFSSANSINIGRLLPQSIYYADASLRHQRETGRKAAFIVPTGNLGNALACAMARASGLPIGDIVLATNANRIIPDYLDGADWIPRDSIATHASAMDVGNPSNMERMRFLFGDNDRLRELIDAIAVSDPEIEAEIARNHEDYGIVCCPHTATGTFAWRQLDAKRRRESDWIIAATAHAAKFESIVEPIIGTEVELPAELASILSRPQRIVRIEPRLDELSAALDERFSR